jgi:aromatic ring-opening dioxygenase LigB subunit
MQESVFSRVVFMCHAPIVIPPIGGGRAEQCAATSKAMQDAANSVAESNPDRVVVLDPHLICSADAYICVETRHAIRGSFKAFGRSDLTVDFPSDLNFHSHLVESAADRRFPVKVMEQQDLDHGAMVPLWFLLEAGYKGPVCVVGYPWRASPESHSDFGRFLRSACGGYKGKTAVMASGDLSHRLQQGAPSGYHPSAHLFDKYFVECVEAGELAKASQVPEDLSDLAAEDSSESMAIAAGAVGETSASAKVLSYEAPFGVGYMVALLA